jgi:hypothetical protein
MGLKVVLVLGNEELGISLGSLLGSSECAELGFSDGVELGSCFGLKIGLLDGVVDGARG